MKKFFAGLFFFGVFVADVSIGNYFVGKYDCATGILIPCTFVGLLSLGAAIAAFSSWLGDII